MKPRIVMSTGNGRLHLVTSAVALLKAGADVHIIQGWVPSKKMMGLVRWLGRLIGFPRLAYGMHKRSPDELKGRIIALADAEFLTQFLLRASRYTGGRFSRSRAAALGWRYFGWRSRAALKRGDMLHVRSGAGQGGMIRRARQLGIKVVVDHSIAHPAWMEQHLRPEYERHQTPFISGTSSPFWRLVAKDCEEADIVLVNSDFVRTTFCNLGLDERKIRVVHLGVRQDFNGLRDWQTTPPCAEGGPLRILFTGAFNFRKGAEYFLLALRELNRRQYPQVQATVVGTWRESTALLKNFDDLQPILRLVDHVPQDELKHYLAQADLYLFPSLAEGCAQSGMEAMSAGLCVLATKESGLPIVHGHTGYLVQAKSVEAIVDRVVWLSANPDAMCRVGYQAVRSLSQFTWRAYAEKVAAVYRELQ